MTVPEGCVWGIPVKPAPPAPEGGGRPELRRGCALGRMLGGWGRMLGGGGGVSGWGVVGRERTGGGGGPEEAPGMDGGAERTGAGGGPLGVGGCSGAAGTGSAGPETTPGGLGERPGRVARGAWGAIDEAGRGGENEGRGGTADDGWTGALAPRSFGLSFSLMLRTLATISKT